jgi:hypothetical protein
MSTKKITAPPISAGIAKLSPTRARVYADALDCSCFHRLNRHRDIAATGDEDNRHVRAFAGDALLKLETIEVWQTHIEYQTARGWWSWTGEKLLRRGEKFRSPAGVRDEELKRFAYRNIVVDNEHDGCDARHGA